jgi:predicted dehydrogenase/threonine dehydrogenase-like Zn-dependent dehydrogenase
MKQIIQNLKTGKVELAEIPVPYVREGHLLIKTSKTLISTGTERMLTDFAKAGLLGKAQQQPDKVNEVLEKIQTDGLKSTINAVLKRLDRPLAPGYSNVGVVIDVGKGVRGYCIGDRILSNGKHAEVVCVPQNLCAHVPESVSDRAAAFGVVGAIALQGIRLAQPTLGETFVVQGLGLIGLLAVQILHAHGCKVIGFDFNSEKAALARKFGADAYVIEDNVDPVTLAYEATQGQGVDGVIISAATKSNEPIHQAPRMCRKRGRIILIGVVGLKLSRADFYQKEITFQVSCSYGPGRYEPNYEEKSMDYPIGFVRWTEQRNFEALLHLMSQGRFQTDKLITDIVPLTKAPQIYEELINRPGLSYLIDYPDIPDTSQYIINLKKKSIIHSLKVSYLFTSSQKPVVGFIGAGAFASSTIIPAFKKTSARLKSIASMSGLSGYHVGKKFGFSSTTTDYRAILDDQEINTVVITTRHNTHAQIVCESLKAGKHVFVEKPLCISHKELEEIKNLYSLTANSNNPRLLMAGFNRRFSPLTKQTKTLIEQSNLPLSMIMTVNAGALPSTHWLQDPQIGGGRIIGEACHFIDLLRFLADHSIVSHHIMKMSSQNNDTFTITLCFNNGSIGTIHYFSNGHKLFPKEQLEVFTNGKIIRLNNFRQVEGFGWKNFTKMKLSAQDKGHNREVSEFIEAIKKGKLSPLPFEEIYEVSQVTLELAQENASI